MHTVRRVGDEVGLLDTANQDVEAPADDAGFDPASWVGTAVGQYEIIRPLGRGGMGAVLLARDTRLGRLVALKLLVDRSGNLSERFLHEARATARLRHENIVVIHEIGEHRDTPYMVLEYLPGKTLAEWLAARTRDPYPDDRRRVRGIAPSLAVEMAIPV